LSGHCESDSCGTMSSKNMEDQSLLAVEPVAKPRSAVNALSAIGLLALGVVLGIALAPAPPGVAHGTPAKIKDATILADLAKGTCSRPHNWCKENARRKDVLSYRDCDGDGILDPYCEGGELLRFGYISSKDGCKDNWPNGLCERPAGDDSELDDAPTADKAASNEITIIHFNDVYTVSGILKGNHRTGGMSRAMKVVEQERARNPDRTFVVFAGDCLSPSMLSNMFEGKQMIDVLNSFKLDAASLGNHEFDFGVDILNERLKESEFPWLNVNIEDGQGNLLPHTTKHLVREVPFAPRLDPNFKNTTKMCFFGAAYDVTVPASKDKDRLGFREVIPASQEEVDHLRTVEKCDIVVALTHQLEEDDCKLSAAMGEKVDLILGGHDHSTSFVSVCGHAPYAKASADLETQWIMTLWLDDKGAVESVDGRIISLTDKDPFNLEMHDKIVQWEEDAEEQLGKKIGCFKNGLETTKTFLRFGETNAGNFVTDAIRDYFGTDFAAFNSGGICGNKMFEAGDVSERTLMELDPYASTIVKVYVTGKELKAFLSDQVNCLDCGDLNQVSGLRYEFDSTKPKGHKLLKVTTADGKAIDEKKEYTLATSSYELGRCRLKNNRLYQMSTKNDALPLIPVLAEAVKKAGDACVDAQTEGRIKDVSKD